MRNIVQLLACALTISICSGALRGGTPTTEALVAHLIESSQHMQHERDTATKDATKVLHAPVAAREPVASPAPAAVDVVTTPHAVEPPGSLPVTAPPAESAHENPSIEDALRFAQNDGDTKAQKGNADSSKSKLPPWLEKPPYWLPTPPEWGAPPAHIYTSWYSPQTIPQPVFRPSPYSLSPKLYSQDLGGVYAPGPYINEQSLMSQMAPRTVMPPPWDAAQMQGVPPAFVQLEANTDRGRTVSVRSQTLAAQSGLTAAKLAKLLNLHNQLTQPSSAVRQDAETQLRLMAQESFDAT